MIIRLVPLLLLVGCGGAQAAEDPEIAFRSCVLKQARALNNSQPPKHAVAEKFAENCSARLASLPRETQQQLTAAYTCALSKDFNKCPAVFDAQN